MQTRSLESTIAALEEKLRLHKEQYTNSKKESLMELVGVAVASHCHIHAALSLSLSLSLSQDLIRVKLDDQTIENSKLSRYTS